MSKGQADQFHSAIAVGFVVDITGKMFQESAGKINQSTVAK